MSLNPIRPLPQAPQVIILGGYEYSIPSVISAGVRSRITDAQMQAFLKEHDLQGMTRDERKQFTEELSDNFSLWCISNSGKTIPAILRAMLTPLNDSPSVDEIYEIASGVETDAVVNFFNGSALPKTLLSNPTEESSEQPSPDGTE